MIQLIQPHEIARLVISLVAAYLVWASVRDLRASVMVPGQSLAGWLLATVAAVVTWVVLGAFQ
jgi:hypothetical protein